MICSPNSQFALDRESRLHTRSGQSIVQGLRTAAFAEYAVVDQSQEALRNVIVF